MFTKERYKLILIASIRPALIVIIAIAVVAFISGRIVAITDMMIERRTAYAVLERRAETINKIREDFDSVGLDAIDKMEATFPPSDNIIEFILAMEALAESAGVQQTLTFATPTPFMVKGEGENAADISSINFSASLNGGADTLLEYLEGIENFPYLTRVLELQITSAGGDWESGASVSVRGVFYTKTIE